VSDRDELLAWLQTHPERLSSSTQDRILVYLDLLEGESKRSGIVSRRDIPRLGMRHIRESLAPELIDRVRSKDVLDIGSGGGLPGVPLAILGVCRSVTLLEPRERRGTFLERVLIQVGVSEARVVEGTLEEFALMERAELWGVATARGVGWTQRMVRALSTVMTEDGILIRFGAPDQQEAGIKVVPIEAFDPRALHVWPRSAWAHLSRD